MAKKKRVVRKTVVKQQKSWVGQKLAWLAAAFGVSIALLTAVTYRGLVQSPQVLEVGGTIEQEWNFDSASEAGGKAWQGYLVILKKVSTEASPIASPIIGLGAGGGGGGGGGVPPKKNIDLKLTVADGLLKIVSSVPMDATTTLFNKNINVDVTNLNTDVMIEVVMRADFIDARNPQGVVTENTVQMIVDFGRKSLTQASKVQLEPDGTAVYNFIFKRGAIGKGNGKIGQIQFKPVTTPFRIMKQNAVIDRITILSK